MGLRLFFLSNFPGADSRVMIKNQIFAKSQSPIDMLFQKGFGPIVDIFIILKHFLHTSCFVPPPRKNWELQMECLMSIRS